MATETTNKFTDVAAPHPVATPRWSPERRGSASSLAILAGVGHGATFLALTAGALWLALYGDEAAATSRRLFIAGLYMQALPALGFAVVSRMLARFGRTAAAMGAACLSVASLLLMGVGTLQIVGATGLQTAFLSAALLLVVAVGIGAFATRLAHSVKDSFETEPVFATEVRQDRASAGTAR